MGSSFPTALAFDLDLWIPLPNDELILPVYFNLIFMGIYLFLPSDRRSFKQ